ncbi:hypothetical protein [Oligosphaera ethanolica]|uniref:FeoB-associated Cys-rich membrane protein n=1 Tax=Oligosphaera ethanolica TaxID=760260 RepID=A0AAE3VDS8_9BACT|nr:hypothetical protein [Oligosphaera ethanolica]MDQ0288667.1 hypothetical protein [Oligosphaera ethanolica]
MAIEHLIVLAIAIIIVTIGIRKARRVLKGSADGCDSGCCQSCGKNCPVKNLPSFAPQKTAPKPSTPEPAADTAAPKPANTPESGPR